MFGAAAAEEKGGGNSREGNAIQEYSRVFFKDFFLEEKESGNQFYIPLSVFYIPLSGICYNRCTNLYLLKRFLDQSCPNHINWEAGDSFFGLAGRSSRGKRLLIAITAPRCTRVKWISNLTSHQIADWEHWEDADDNRKVQ